MTGIHRTPAIGTGQTRQDYFSFFECFSTSPAATQAHSTVAAPLQIGSEALLRRVSLGALPRRVLQPTLAERNNAKPWAHRAELTPAHA